MITVTRIITTVVLRTKPLFCDFSGNILAQENATAPRSPAKKSIFMILGDIVTIGEEPFVCVSNHIRRKFTCQQRETVNGESANGRLSKTYHHQQWINLEPTDRNKGKR
jgi:hypothetical protein